MTKPQGGSIRIHVWILPLILLASACASVPQGASEANGSVSEGIRALRDQHIETIRAFGNSVRASIQATWDNEIIYRTIKEVGKAKPNGDYSEDDIAAIAGTAMGVRDELLYQVDVKEEALIASVRKNYNGLVKMNDVVTGYLSSLEKLDSAQQALQKRLLSTVGIEGNQIPEEVRELVNIAEDPIAAVPGKKDEPGNPGPGRGGTAENGGN